MAESSDHHDASSIGSLILNDIDNDNDNDTKQTNSDGGDGETLDLSLANTNGRNHSQEEVVQSSIGVANLKGGPT